MLACRPVHRLWQDESVTTRIRPISVAAADIVAILHADIFSGHHDECWSREFLGKILSTPGTTAFVALDNEVEEESPIGFAVLRISGEEGEVRSLGVTATMRRRGVGGALLKNVLRFAAEVGTTSMVLEVAENNTPARELYRQHGFVVVGRRRDYFRHGNARIDAIILRASTPPVT